MWKSLFYSLFQKKRTFNSEFFCGPPWGGGPKIHMVDYVNGGSTHAQFFSLENIFKTVADFLTKKIEHVQNSHLHNQPCECLAPLHQGGTKKFGIKCAFLLEQIVFYLLIIYANCFVQLYLLASYWLYDIIVLELNWQMLATSYHGSCHGAVFITFLLYTARIPLVSWKDVVLEIIGFKLMIILEAVSYGSRQRSIQNVIGKTRCSDFKRFFVSTWHAHTKESILSFVLFFSFLCWFCFSKEKVLQTERCRLPQFPTPVLFLEGFVKYPYSLHIS